MSKIVKKMKIMQPGGTLSDYVPIGAEAENIKTTDGESVQLKLNKTIYIDDIIDNLESSAINKPLSAKQGKILNDSLNRLINKKIVLIGDSYLEGYNPDGNVTS